MISLLRDLKSPTLDRRTEDANCDEVVAAESVSTLALASFGAASGDGRFSSADLGAPDVDACSMAVLAIDSPKALKKSLFLLTADERSAAAPLPFFTASLARLLANSTKVADSAACLACIVKSSMS